MRAIAIILLLDFCWFLLCYGNLMSLIFNLVLRSRPSRASQGLFEAIEADDLTVYKRKT